LDKGAELTNKLLANGSWESKFFRFINFLEVHEPYRNYNSKEVWDNVTGIKPLSQKAMQNIRKEYIAEMEYLDGQIGKLISNLKKAGKYDNTMIIITSDHGQAINEHGYMLHSTYLYDELTRIPLIIKYPGSRKFEAKKGYQNLVYLPKLIKDVMDGGDDSAVYSETTFSEAYGAVIVLPGGYKNREEYVRKTYEKVRKAVYKDGFKLTVNGTDGIIEEFMEGGKNIKVEDNKEKAKELLNEIDIFKGKEDFKMPEI
jgi:Arylsulfatase A and related enzymes